MSVGEWGNRRKVHPFGAVSPGDPITRILRREARLRRRSGPVTPNDDPGLLWRLEQQRRRREHGSGGPDDDGASPRWQLGDRRTCTGRVTSAFPIWPTFEYRSGPAPGTALAQGPRPYSPLYACSPEKNRLTSVKLAITVA